MNEVNLLPFFVVGLAGSVHCAGMCGGIVSAFSMAQTPRAFPVAVVTLEERQAPSGTLRAVCYNAGRIASYATAGAIAGGLAGGARTLAGLATWQAAGYWMANLVLIVLGLYLMDAWRSLAVVEGLGQGLWRKIRPWTSLLLPLDSPLKLLALGALWGWLPCGMVYSVLLGAALTGSAGSGAVVMLAFGLGTLPLLLTMGAAGAGVRTALQTPLVRRASGLLVLAFGVLGIARAAGGIDAGWLDAFCLTQGPP